MNNENIEPDALAKRISARLRATPSRGNNIGIDPDNPYEIQKHERDKMNFLSERMSLHANILYVHGFASAGNSDTAKTIQKYLPKCHVISPDLPVDPDEALRLLHNTVDREKIDVVVGTSMGGMFAQKLRGVPKVLVNPSFHISESMCKKIGFVPFFAQRADGATEFEVTPMLCDSYHRIENGQFNDITRHEQEITYGLFGTDDDVVNCETEYDKYYSNKMIFIGGHRLTADAIHDYVIEAILRLLPKN